MPQHIKQKSINNTKKTNNFMSQKSNQLKTVSPQLLVLSPVGTLGRGGTGVWHLDVGTRDLQQLCEDVAQ